MKIKFFFTGIIVLFFLSCQRQNDIENNGDNNIETTATPTANLQAGTYNSVQYVKLETATEGATIYYSPVWIKSYKKQYKV